jgi:hypothetical protein
MPVKRYISGLCVALMTVGMLGVAGCGTENEKEGEQLSKSMGDPGAVNAAKATPVVTPPPPKSMEEYGKQQPDMHRSDYPGGKKK